MKASPFNCTLIQIYAPISEYSDDEVEEFYKQIEYTMQQALRHNFLIVMCDWNDVHSAWPNNIGRFSNISTN